MVIVEMEGHIVPIVKKQSGQKVGPTIKPQGPPPCPTSIRNVLDAENWACSHCNFSCSFHRQELGLRCSVCCTEQLCSPDPRLLYVSESGLWYETSLLPSLPRMQFCQMLEAKDTACRWEEKEKKKVAWIGRGCLLAKQHSPVLVDTWVRLAPLSSRPFHASPLCVLRLS